MSIMFQPPLTKIINQIFYQPKKIFSSISKTPTLTLFISIISIAYSIPKTILKLASDTLSKTLFLLINKSFLINIFSNDFKIVKLVPVFMGASRILSSNYSSITLLSKLGKIIENSIGMSRYHK